LIVGDCWDLVAHVKIRAQGGCLTKPCDVGVMGVGVLPVAFYTAAEGPCRNRVTIHDVHCSSDLFYRFSCRFSESALLVVADSDVRRPVIFQLIRQNVPPLSTTFGFAITILMAESGGNLYLQRQSYEVIRRRVSAVASVIFHGEPLYRHICFLPARHLSFFHRSFPSRLCS
jgi:hypothetical protein